MYARMLRILYSTLLLFVFAAWSGAAAAGSLDDSKTVGGITFYLGILPSEIVLGHPKTHAEGSMHDGPSARSGQYHIVVALFDAATEQRISDAQVTARVMPLGMSEEEKALESMPIGAAPSYGNFFNMPGKGPFGIVIQVRRPGVTGKVEAVFEHRH
jgi:hypothetical protein